MAAIQRVQLFREEEERRYNAAVAQLREAGLISGTQTAEKSQSKKCSVTCAWDVWPDTEDFDGGCEFIMSSMQLWQDNNRNRTFATASVWSEPIEEAASGSAQQLDG